MGPKIILAQKCVPTITLGHSCAYVATRTVEAQGCLGVMAKAGEMCLVGQSPWSNSHSGPGPNEASNLGKGLGGGAAGVKWKSPVRTRHVWNYVGISPGGTVPGSGLALWRSKPFGASTCAPDSSMTYSVSWTGRVSNPAKSRPKNKNNNINNNNRNNNANRNNNNRNN
jgi:hypothetical protein